MPTGFGPVAALMCHVVARRISKVRIVGEHARTRRSSRMAREYNIAVLGSGGVGKSALTGEKFSILPSRDLRVELSVACSAIRAGNLH